MLPVLKPGHDVLVLCWFFKLKAGDLIVFKKSGKEMIKRIQSCNGRSIFVIGDNKKESTDSRNFGPVDRAQIIGKVLWY